MGEHKRPRLLAANGTEIETPETAEQIEARQIHVRELMDAVAALIDPESRDADYLTVGVNMMQAFIFGGGAPEFENRVKHATQLLMHAVNQSFANNRLSDQVVAKLKEEGRLN